MKQRNIYTTSLYYITLIALVVIVGRFIPSGTFSNSVGSTGPLFTSNKKVKMEGPEYFQRYQTLIRTQEGKDRPDYTPGYITKAWRKAKENNISYREKLEWKERGPGNVGGRTRGLLVDPDDPTHQTWYAGSVGGGVWKTTDGGEHWQNLTPDIPNLATATLAMSPHNTQVIYAGTGEGFDGRMINGSGMWKSNDKGSSWSPIKSTLSTEDFRNILRIIVNPDDENELVVCTVSNFVGDEEKQLVSKIMRSTDGGQTWTQSHQETGTVIQQVVFTPGNFNTQYASVNGRGILQSTDGGKTWNKVMSVSSSEVRRMELSVSPINPKNVFIAAEVADGSRLYISRDGMKTVQTVIYEDGSTPDWLGGQGFYDNTIAAHPFNENKVWVGGASAILELEVSEKTDSIRSLDSYEVNASFLEDVPFDQIPFEPVGIADDVANFFLLNTEATSDDFINVEIRFGPQKKQKAHIISLDGTTFSLDYSSYQEVPFEVWDTENNRQLMVSVLDFDGDGKWTLLKDINDAAFAPDLILINILDYKDTPDDTISLSNPVYKSRYYFYVQLDSNYNGSLDVFPKGEINIYAGTFLGFVTQFDAITDGYGQFGDVGSKGVHVDHHNILFIPVDSASGSFQVLNANDGGVAYSRDNGQTFRQTGDTFKEEGEDFDTYKGYNVSQFYGVDKMNGGDRYVGGTQDNGSWVSPIDADAEKAWVSAPSGDGFEAAWNFGNPNLILESSQFNDISKSTDGGQTWNQVNLPVSEGPFITRIASSQLDPDLVFISSLSGLVKSTDFGDTWSIKDMPYEWEFDFTGPPIQISLSDANVVWSGSGMTNTSHLVYSKDKGETWSVANNYTQAKLGAITGIATHPTEPATAFALFSQANGPKVLRTKDFGMNWQDLSGFVSNKDESDNGFPDVACFSLLVMPFNTDQIWVGTEIGLFESLDGGQSWHYADNGCPAVAIYQMKIVNDQIVLATHGRGIWTVNTQMVSASVNPTKEQTQSIRVSPNPITESAIITLDVEPSAYTTVTLHSINGIYNKVIYRGPVSKSKTLSFNRGTLPSGIYFITAKTNTSTYSKKVILL